MSPVTPDDFLAVIPDSTSSKCAAFVKALLKLPALLWQLVSWMLDSDGNLTTDFLRATQPTGSLLFAAAELDSDSLLLCDGTAVSRTTYADLFNVIGTTYGVGDGSTTFNLPDFRDRFPIGKSGTKAGGSTGGEDEHELVESELPEHTHRLANSTTNDTAAVLTGTKFITRQGVGTSDSDHRYSFSESLANAAPDVGSVGNTGGGVAFPMLPLYVALWIYIRI